MKFVEVRGRSDESYDNQSGKALQRNRLERRSSGFLRIRSSPAGGVGMNGSPSREKET